MGISAACRVDPVLGHQCCTLYVGCYALMAPVLYVLHLRPEWTNAWFIVVDKSVVYRFAGNHLRITSTVDTVTQVSDGTIT